MVRYQERRPSLLMDVPVGINKEGPIGVAGERPMAQPLLGRAQQDHVLVLPH